MNGQEKTLQDKESLIQGLKAKLDWFTFEASEEEYDEKAVESILYLLDGMEPFREEDVPMPQESWEKFRKLVKERGEIDLPEAEGEEGLEREGPLQDRELSREACVRKADDTELSVELGITVDIGTPRKNGRKGKYVLKVPAKRKRQGGERGAMRYKCIAAAALLMLAVTVIGTGRAGASPDTGFFHWLRHDNTKLQMVTSPESLDGDADIQGVQMYTNSDDVPEWAQEWIKIDNEFEMPEEYDWNRFEVEELRNLHKITSCYLEYGAKRELLLGMVIYSGEVSFNTEEFMDYGFIESCELEHKQMYIYGRVDQVGVKSFLIYFFEGKCQYYIQGQENLDELKSLIGRYWLAIKNKFKKNEKICNKLLSQAIYR